MSARGYVAITLAVVGLLLSLTLYGLAISWIFLVPAVILARKEGKRLFSETGKTAGVLVVFQVLSWISLGLSAFLVLCVGYLYLSSRPPAQQTSVNATPAVDQFLSEYNRHYLAKVYGATVDVISMADAGRIESWGGILVFDRAN